MLSTNADVELHKPLRIIHHAHSSNGMRNIQKQSFYHALVMQNGGAFAMGLE